MEANLPKDIKMASVPVYISGYVACKEDQSDVSKFYVELYGQYMNLLHCGDLTLPGDQIC